jgi:hypothetical protein
MVYFVKKPTLDIQKFASAGHGYVPLETDGKYWQIYVNDVLQADAILERVNTQYGPSFSDATFRFEKNPQTVSLTASGQEVKIYINKVLVLSGYLIRREDTYSSSDLKVTYTAVNSLWAYTRTSITENFNTSPQQIFIRGVGYEEIPVSISKILSQAGCPSSGAYGEAYGEIQAAGQTKLEFMNNMCSTYFGSQKIFCSPEGGVSYYSPNTAYQQRTYEIGKQILSLDQSIDVTNSSGVTGGIRVESAPSRVYAYTLCPSYSLKPMWSLSNGQRVFNLATLTPGGTAGNIHLDFNGNYSLLYTINAPAGSEISNVQVFAEVNEKPQVSLYATNIQVTPGHVKWQAPSEEDSLWDNNFWNPNTPVEHGDYLTNWNDGGTEGRFAVLQYKKYPAMYKPISSSVSYLGNTAWVSISPLPSYYKENIVTYTIDQFIWQDNQTVAQSADIYLENEPIEFLANIIITYSYRGSRLTAGSGTGRVIVDGVVPIIKPWMPGGISEQIDEKDNATRVQEYLNERYTSEVGRLTLSNNEAAITILGDETLDLRAHVNGLAVSKITHEFGGDGFITHIDLTNTQYTAGVTAYREKEMDKYSSKLVIDDVKIDLNYDHWQVTGLADYLKNTSPTKPKSGAGNYTS